MRTITFSGDLAPIILRDITLGLNELGKVVDLGAVFLSEDPTVQTAQTEISARGLELHVNAAYFASGTDLNPAWRVGDPIQPGKDAPDYMGLHEGLHAFFNRENPAFEAHVSQVRIGGTNTFDLFFNGTNAVAINGGPVPIDQWGHLLGSAFLGDIMSGSYPTFRDRPQVLSAIDLAVLKDVGAPLAETAAHPSTLDALYVASLGRAPDAAGLGYWRAVLAGGTSLDSIAQSFFAQPEAQALYANKTPAALVDAVYHNAFGHAADPAGAAYWTHELESGHVHEGEFVLAIIDGAQGQDAIHLIGLTEA